MYPSIRQCVGLSKTAGGINKGITQGHVCDSIDLQKKCTPINFYCAGFVRIVTKKDLHVRDSFFYHEIVM